MSALDGKGRFALPMSFRSVLNEHSDEPGSMYLRAEPERECVTLFGTGQADYFQARGDRTAALAEERGEDFDPDDADIDFWGTIKTVTIDTGGRFTIPPSMKKLYGITDGIFIVGGGRLCRLWDPERYLATETRNRLALEECAAFLEELKAKREGRA